MLENQYTPETWTLKSMKALIALITLCAALSCNAQGHNSSQRYDREFYDYCVKTNASAAQALGAYQYYFTNMSKVSNIAEQAELAERAAIRAKYQFVDQIPPYKPSPQVCRLQLNSLSWGKGYRQAVNNLEAVKSRWALSRAQ